MHGTADRIINITESRKLYDKIQNKIEPWFRKSKYIIFILKQINSIKVGARWGA